MNPRPHPLVLVFALAHALVGAYWLWVGVGASFAGSWWLAAFGGPLLLANGVGLGVRREALDRKMSGVLAGLMRFGGGFGLILGALGSKEGLDGAWTVMGFSLAVGLWGLAFGHVLDRFESTAQKA